MTFRILRSMILTVFALVASGVAAQQDATPQVSVELSDSETIPGQTVDLRITVLVPTWMTKPVVFPAFEALNVLVRVPDRGTSPISENIAGETWSGVTRRYKITPMVPGRFLIPAQEILVTWADPDTNEPREDIIAISDVQVTGVVPDAAADLDPFIAAEALALTQQISGSQAPLLPGDSVIREITASIEGVSPMFLPGLLDTTPIQGVSVYPSEPVLSETSNRGVTSGTRTESVTYLAQSGGADMAPALSIDWYNLGTGAVETATVEGIDLSVDAPVAREGRELSPQKLIWLCIGVAVLLVIVALTWRSARRHWIALRTRRQSRYRASASFDRDQTRSAIARRDLSATLNALDRWARRFPDHNPGTDPAVVQALATLGALRYANDAAGTSETACWSGLDATVRSYQDRGTRDKEAAVLPPLNPHPVLLEHR